jgi:hypothetical protein
MNTAKVFMAFAKGSESTDGTIVKRYTGVAPCYVVGVNPSKSELETIYGTTIENVPEYRSSVDVDGKKIETVRIDFIVKTDPTNSNEIDMTSKVALFLRKEYRFNRDKSKVQVIDKYGRTAWVTIEQAKAHEVPVYANGPANLDSDYRPCFVGEEELTNFIKAYLNIPNVMKYVDGKWVMVDNPEDCVARLDCIEKYFAGDYAELKEVINLQPNNKVKILFGVKTNDDGKQYQAVFTQMFLKNGVRDYSKLSKELEDRKAAGAYPTTEFFIGALKEYTTEATNFTSSTPVVNPFATDAMEEDNPFGL